MWLLLVKLFNIRERYIFSPMTNDTAEVWISVKSCGNWSYMQESFMVIIKVLEVLVEKPRESRIVINLIHYNTTRWIVQQLSDKPCSKCWGYGSEQNRQILYSHRT